MKWLCAFHGVSTLLCSWWWWYIYLHNGTVMFALQMACSHIRSVLRKQHNMTDSRCTSNLLPSCICC
jgi:hypothetical protein